MSLPLAVQAAAVYALALLLARTGAASTRRAVLITACAVVAALPLLSFAPRWSPVAPPPALVAEAAGVVLEPAATAPAVAATPSPWRPSPAPILGWVWGAGFAVAAARLGADLLAVRRLRASAVGREGDVARSDRVTVPVVVGVLRPLVLLPSSAGEWSAARRDLVLAHERAHARGGDNGWLLLGRIAACVHWFDPLAWWALAALRDACEHHADDTVVEGGADPAEYALALVELARGRAPAAALAMARPTGLERRVRAVLGARIRPRRGSAALGGTLIAGLALGTATAAPARRPEPVSAPSSLGALLEAEADHLLELHHPEGVALLVLDARTGAVIGRADRGGLAERPVSPGSVLKPFTAVAALESGVALDHRFADGDLASILERSSNPGALQVAELAGRSAVAAVFGRVGLPAPETLPLDRIVLGDVPVTPLQVATAWTHLAGHGAVPAPIAATTRELLVGAVEGEEATGREAAVPGVRVAGKTGTAPLVRADGTVDPERYLASFVGLVPADDPEVVVLVSVAGPDGEQVWGGVVAAPAFRRIVEGAAGAWR